MIAPARSGSARRGCCCRSAVPGGRSTITWASISWPAPALTNLSWKDVVRDDLFQPRRRLAWSCVSFVASLHYLVHWPTHGGYNFVSGPLADITLITAFATTLFLWLRKHNCHVHRCWRLQWHVDPS